MTSSEDLLQQQSELLEAIKSIGSNFKKDGASRKMDVGYHDERLQRLDNFWNKFDWNDQRLSLLTVERTGEYYQKRVKEKLEITYKEIRDMIERSKMQLEENIQKEEAKLRAELEKKGVTRGVTFETGASTSYQQSTTASGADSGDEFHETSLDGKTIELLNEQKSHVKAFERAICNLNIDNITEKWQFEDKLKTISLRWESYDKLYWKLDNMIKDNRSSEEQYDKLEHMYETAKTLINEKIWDRNHQEKSAPKIEIPTFHGNYSHWTTFKDLFKETVHNNSFISKAQKMQHLKAKLKGEAERLVQHLTISADNYDTCWSILQQRYDNIRLLFTYHANELLNQPIIQQATAFQIKRMHDAILENLNAITNLQIETKNWDPLLVHILIQKLDSDTKQAYIESLESPREIPKLADFLTFLENKFMALESTNTKPASAGRNIHDKHQNNNNNNKNMPQKRFQPISIKQEERINKPFLPKSFYNKVEIKCPKCNQQHGLYKCKEFLDMTSCDRLSTANKLGVCKNCLFSHHGNQCTSTQKCKECNQSHSTLLHEAVSNEPRIKNNRVSNHLWNENDTEVLLATAMIDVETSSGKFITLRALLDQGSQVSLITEDAAQRLQQKRRKINAVVTGVGAVRIPTNRCKGIIQLTLKATNSNGEFTTGALVMDAITSKLPNKNIDITTIKTSLDHIPLADPQFNISRNIDILLGADIFAEVLLEGLIKINDSTMTAQQTHLGWIICGKHKTLQCHVTINNLEEIEKFWEQEEIKENKSKNLEQNEEEVYCETLYKETTERLADGRYQVRLPLTPYIKEKLGTSKPQAVAQFKQLERKMKTNIMYAERYKEFMSEYKHLGHMIKAEAKNKALLQYFMPHHGVVRESAITTKLRVVFNASAKTSTKYSLNSLMESGPNLQADLQGILLQWRQHQYVLTADIEKMYRYIAVHPDDQTLQKIIWRENAQQPLEEYQLCTVTYGTKAAPFLALRTLKQLAEDEGENFPKAKPVLQNNFFMDDAMFGSNTIDEAKEIRDQLMHLLSNGGFNLRKWASNAPQLVEDLPKEMRNPLNFNFTETDSSKTLGLGWNPKNDHFVFSPVLKHKETRTITKRQILSDVSSLFDPLGWLAPITVKSKIMFQQVWKTSLGWDEAVPENIQKEWRTLSSELITMEQFKIKRWLGFTPETTHKTQLFGFCDASEKAIACVVYSTVPNPDGTYMVNMVAAKTKLAPIRKKQSLPRLELCGAQLLAKLVHKIKQCINNPEIKVTAWTDSMVVLGWLKGEETRWKSYVANRVQSTKRIIPAENWNYINTKNNPADCASRGLLPTQLSTHSLWWQGPEWLKTNNVPKNSDQQGITLKEETKVFTAAVQRKEPNVITKTLNNCNSIAKAVRVISWVSRFIAKARAQSAACSKHITLHEMKAARNKIIQQVQRDHFYEELRALKTNQEVNKNSKIWKLNPFLDEAGLLRIGGRLQHSNLAENAKHPFVIPQHSRLSELVIDEAHKTTLHGGARLTLATLRQQYWVIGGTTTVKKSLRKCVTCTRYTTTKQQQLMGELPQPRVAPSPPFYHTGVDFTGWVDIKLNKGRGVRTSKGYVAVFICMATKAVHLELVTDLTTQTFILALKRMAARRGCPAHLYSDNATNFLGADRELQRQLQTTTFNNDLVSQTLAEQHIQWHFNAPSWPSAGGIWEAAVKSMKYHLKRVLGVQKLTYEEFQTLLTQIEACMNSRPLCPLTEDADDAGSCLTPGHFLIGRPIISVPQEKHDNNINTRQRWQLTEKMFQGFWKQWSLEYLHLLQQRGKWNTKTRDIKQGDIVLVKEDNLPPMKWALGRVLDIHPGKDHLVRVVTVKTQNSVYKRPITKLVLLPVTNSDEYTGPTAPNSSNTSQTINIPTKKRSGRTGRSTLLAILGVLLTIFHPTTQTEDLINITAFQENKLVYFDNMGKMQTIHDTWKIVTYYNMTTYWDGYESAQGLTTHVDNRCKHFVYRIMCDSITSHLKQEIENLEHNNGLLKTGHGMKPRRVTRGLINGVGYLANSLFGILDDSFAQKYSSDIEAVNNNEKHLLSLIKNQTSIVEAHNNILKRNEKAMKAQFQLIQDHLNKTEQFIQDTNNRISEEDNQIYFNLMTLAANMIINKLQNIQHILLGTITNIHHGQVDTRLFSQEQLREELNLISGQLPAHLYLPLDNTHDQLNNIYKLLTAKARVTEKYFIIEMSLPLTSDIKFNLYRTIPVPMKDKDSTFKLKMQSEYIAVNLRKDIYMPLNNNDISACNKIDTYNNLICTINKPTYNMRNSGSPCEVSIITNTSTQNCIYEEEPCADKWVPLQKPNAWMYFCCNECLTRIICDEHMTTRSLRMAGIIDIKQGCIIKHGEATIYTQRYFQNNININQQIPVSYKDLGDLNSIAISRAISPPKKQITTDFITGNLDELQNKIETLQKQSILPDTVSTHDVHQYAISYTTLAIVVVILVVAGCKYLHWRRRHNILVVQRSNTLRSKQQQDLTVQNPEPAIEMASTSRTRTVNSQQQPLYALPRKISFKRNTKFDI